MSVRAPVLAIVIACAVSADPLPGRSVGAAPRPRSLETRQLVSVLVGDGPREIGWSECAECGDCDAGAAFLGPAGDLYFYDYSRGDLKVIDTGARPGVREVIRGVGVPPAQNPVDGAVAADGTIFLLTDTGRAADRFRLYWSKSASEWDSSPWFDHPELGRDSQGRSAWGGVRLEVLGNAVALFDVDRRSSSAHLIWEGGVLVADQRRRTPPGVPQAGGGRLEAPARARGADRSPSLDPRHGMRVGEFFGVDAKGRAFFLVSRDSDRPRIQVFDSHGNLLADAPAPERTLVRGLAGRGSKFVTADGRALLLSLDERRLLAYEIAFP